MDPRSFTRWLSDVSCAIYLFHGVVERHEHTVRNANRKHIARAEFQSLLQALRESGTPLTMDEVLEHLVAQRSFPPRAFAITFDDGFANNATIAAPILDGLRIPATFYLTTGWIGTRERSWIDRLEACFERTPSGTVVLPWESFGRTCATPQDCIAVLAAIRSHVKTTPTVDRDAFVASVFAQQRCDESATWSEALDAKLTWEQACALAAHPRFTIGGHTHTHAMLAFCAPTELEAEIRTSVQMLREHGGVAARHYAYPEGLAQHYSDAVIARLKHHGIRCCPTAITGTVTVTSDPFHLRRIPVMDTTPRSSFAM